MNKELLKVSIRHGAVFISKEHITGQNTSMNETTSVLLANATKLGFTFSEELLQAINSINPTSKLDLLEALKEVTGVKKNWTPLVKEWSTPTGESVMDHVITFFGNLFQTKKGIRLECGHIIPDHTFPLERYNGCPFCGTPFEFETLTYEKQGSKLKVLELWNEKDLEKCFEDLLASKTALDATQMATIKTLLKVHELPTDVNIGMKETSMAVIDALVENQRGNEAQALFKNANDILRFLWYKHTGFLQLILPKTTIKRMSKNAQNIFSPADQSGSVKLKTKADLKLKYTRKECKQVATWLTSLELTPEKVCESMHPKRGMWVRFIRALRLAEYAKRPGFEKLATMMDVFYNQTYEVWQGKVNHFKLKGDPDMTFALLKERPGLFARSLFSTMLWFGSDPTLTHFKEIAHKIPARLLITLNMYADTYFDKNAKRSVKPLGGTGKMIAANKLVHLYDEKTLTAMKSKIEALCLTVIKQRFASEKNENKTIFIADGLFNIPLSIGDRSETVQDLPSALMGTRFPIEGNTVRLFLQWGEGLPAQHLDMDLSCIVAFPDNTSFCSYSQLVIPGCKHSGDIQRIPEKVGTAEYIDMDVEKLQALGAKYVSFTCNAYTNGGLSPNLVVGWMDSKFPMRITRKGVAYDPSCVQHQVRITNTMAKGLVFGVLDVAAKEIIWLEMSFGGQVVQNLDTKSVEALLSKLDSKLSVGNLLTIKAEAQGLTLVEDPAEADEMFDLKWAMNTAAVTQMFLD